ncbi:MAG: NADPH-dependent assimilatory sulfite reductase hemoprotein subunit [Litorilinea sp.]
MSGSVETLKATSNGLRGALPIQLAQPTPLFDDDVKNLLKFHGIYQQHDRDVRGRNNRVYSFMVRSRIPGGRLNAFQYLIHDALADAFGQHDLRLTTRQGIQLHGVIKENLKPTLRGLNETLISTLAACGDVARNVMFCPAPFGDPVREQIQAVAQAISDHLRPHTRAYHEIWLEDEEGNKVRQSLESAAQEAAATDTAATDTTAEIEPIYGKTYMPRKFKIALAFPGDNCTDIFSNDIGLVGLVAEDGETVHGYNLYVGGGLGQTHNAAETFPHLAEPLGYASHEQVLDVVEKIVLVQRDFGNREDRKLARMKYLVYNWGIEAFRAKVFEYLGYELEPVHPMPDMGYDDHMGWHEQRDGRWFCGIYVENGRVADAGATRIRSGLRAVIQKYKPNVTITGQQNIILSGFQAEERDAVDALLAEYNIAPIESLSRVRRHSMACPALPSCGLALAEAERYLPSLIDELEPIVAELGLDQEDFSIRMTGCPNGCARPYVADLGIVGRTLGKYNLHLGGNMEGTRLNTLYQELVPAAELPQLVRNVLTAYLATRTPQERVGDWASRLGAETIAQHVAQQTSVEHASADKSAPITA